MSWSASNSITTLADPNEGKRNAKWAVLASQQWTQVSQIPFGHFLEGRGCLAM